jgi:hypothetical protein
MGFASNGIRDAFEGQGEAGFVAWTWSPSEEFPTDFMSSAAARASSSIDRPPAGPWGPRSPTWAAASTVDQLLASAHCRAHPAGRPAIGADFVTELARCPGIGPRSASRRRSVASR